MPTDHSSMDGKGFHARFFSSFMVWQGRQGRRVEQAEFGALVGKAMHRKAYTQAAVSRWFTEAVPDLHTIEGIAKVLGTTPGYLAFGEGEPPNDPMTPTAMPRKR